jgi:DNA-binding XRE family transcriptional regulator
VAARTKKSPARTMSSKRMTLRQAEAELARLGAAVDRLRREILALKGEGQAARSPEALPPLPAPNADGNYPAEEALDVILARQIIRRRQAAGWTQAELARRAGVREETVSRVESAKHAPTLTTVEKLDRALRASGV